MKVLQLSSSAEPHRRLDLHPQVTVIRGTDQAKRSWIVGALAGLPQGRADGVAGVVEAHGVRFDLDADTLALLDLHAELDVVVEAEDLPGHDPTVGLATAARRVAESRRDDELQRLHRARAAVAAANEATAVLAATLDDLRSGGGAVREAVEAAAAARAQLEAELAAARADRQRREHDLAVAVSAEEAVAAVVARAEQRAHAAREHRRLALEAATLAAAELEAARSSLDHAAADELALARAHLAEVEWLADQAAVAAQPPPAAEPEPGPGPAAGVGASVPASRAEPATGASPGGPGGVDPGVGAGAGVPPGGVDVGVDAPGAYPAAGAGIPPGGVDVGADTPGADPAVGVPAGAVAPPPSAARVMGPAVAARVAELEERHADLSRLALAVGDGADAGAVRAALEVLRSEPVLAHAASATSATSATSVAAAPSVPSVPAATAMSLADTWRDIHQQLAALAVFETTEGPAGAPGA
ncbi:MAG: hypothetical protein JWN46_1285, partial [Acidimicrobiales bacterium]|nr:hypothetical protein [Acidimicrobiales bacterium]